MAHNDPQPGVCDEAMARIMAGDQPWQRAIQRFEAAKESGEVSYGEDGRNAAPPVDIFAWVARRPLRR